MTENWVDGDAVTTPTSEPGGGERSSGKTTKKNGLTRRIERSGQYLEDTFTQFLDGGEEEPKTRPIGHKLLALLVTLFALPIGPFIGVICWWHIFKSDELHIAGHEDAAAARAKKAQNWAVVGITLWLIFIALALLGNILSGNGGIGWWS